MFQNSSFLSNKSDVSEGEATAPTLAVYDFLKAFYYDAK